MGCRTDALSFSLTHHLVPYGGNESLFVRDLICRYFNTDVLQTQEYLAQKAGLLQTPFLPPAAAGRHDEASTPRASAKVCLPLHSYHQSWYSQYCNNPG